MRRKLFSSLLLFVFIFTAVAGFGTSKNVNAADTTVKVTISNAGELVVTQVPVKVTDVDNDGKLTVNDVLIIVHTDKYADGASGYALGATGFVEKLWGVSNGGSYGFYRNNTMTGIVAQEEVQNGDYIVAYSYKDLTSWSDAFSYFDAAEKKVNTGAAVTLTLFASGYDASWNPVVAPLADATITVNGVATDIKTDAEGKATITLKDAGTAVISATHATQTIVPPVCTVTVGTTPDTGVSSTLIMVVLLVAAVSLMAAIVVKKRAR